ncbi:uncharacterized protein JN550_004853 [Neoarthrinium moseri]|nr:uncharacterized protein JN550_004853 [Neoarthrinium moseri]KAI1870707.1 hypothetical protein JN550_004853 [Neoarthrinium moseri]
MVALLPKVCTLKYHILTFRLNRAKSPLTSLTGDGEAFWYSNSQQASRPRLDGEKLLLGLLFSSLDASIVSTSLVSISLDMNDFLNSPWVALSYLLAYLGFAVCFAKASDIYGRRNLLIAAWILFAGFSVGCGLAGDMHSLIVFRAFQGIGGSGLYSLAQIVLYEVGPSDKPSLLGALIGMTLAVSFVLGPVLGGTISHLASWRWIFLINAPCGIIALIGLFSAWPQTRTQQLGPSEIFRKVDLLGNLLIMLGSSLLVFSLQQAGSYNLSWRNPAIIATLSVAATSWAGFVAWEIWLGRRRHPLVYPVFPIRLIKQRAYMASLVCTFFAGFTYLSIIIILPERFQIVNGNNSLMGGLHLLPMLGACAFGSFLAGALSSKRNNTSLTLITASCLQLLGIGLLSTLSDAFTAIDAQYGYQAIIGLGVGLSFAATTILTSVRSEAEDLAVAQGAVAQSRIFGGAVGIAICMIIFNNQVQNDLGARLGPEDLSALRHNPVVSTYFPVDTQLLIRETYARAFTSDVRLLIGASSLGLVASLFAFELHPPPMRSGGESKELLVLGPGFEQSETELDEIASTHRLKVSTGNTGRTTYDNGH